MQTIYLDISNKGVIPCIMAKQSEVGRKFLAVITDNGVPYNVPDNALLSVWYEGNTDAGNYSSIEEKSAFVIDGNKVSVELVAQMLLNPGSGELCLSITHGDGGETNTWNIPYEVEYKPGVGSSVPTEYYTALTEAGAYAAEQATLARQYAETAQEAAENRLSLDGGTMNGDINMGGNTVSMLGAPMNDGDAVPFSLAKMFGIGIGRIMDVPNNNFNTLKGNSIYKGLHGGAVGFPEQMAEWAFVLTLHYDDDSQYGVQFALDMKDNYMGLRNKRNGEWNSWAYFTPYN